MATTSMRNLPDVAYDAVPKTKPVDSEIQPLTDREVSQVSSNLESMDLPSNVANMISNTVNNAPANMTMIVGSSGFQIGNKYKFGLNSTKKEKHKSTKQKPSPPKPKPEVEAMFSMSSQEVSAVHIRDVRMGKHWKRVMRQLNILDIEIENKIAEHFNTEGVEEVIYQLLRLWIEKNGSSATLDKLSKALWKEKQTDALEVLIDAFQIKVLSSKK